MKRLLFALTIALSVHFLFLFFLPSLFIKPHKAAKPEIKSVLITMSYRAPEPVKHQAVKRVDAPKPVQKKTPPPPRTKKPAPPSPKKKAVPIVKKPKLETELQPLEKIQPQIPRPEKPKPQQATVHQPELKNPTHVKGQPMKSALKPLERTQKNQAPPVQRINMTAPEYKNNPSPSYPKKARKKGYQGLVELLVLISIDGRASQIKIKKSTGHRILDQRAVRTVKRWTFKPRKNGRQAIETWVIVPIRFKLN